MTDEYFHDVKQKFADDACHVFIALDQANPLCDFNYEFPESSMHLHLGVNEDNSDQYLAVISMMGYGGLIEHVDSGPETALATTFFEFDKDGRHFKLSEHNGTIGLEVKVGDVDLFMPIVAFEGKIPFDPSGPSAEAHRFDISNGAHEIIEDADYDFGVDGQLVLTCTHDQYERFESMLLIGASCGIVDPADPPFVETLFYFEKGGDEWRIGTSLGGHAIYRHLDKVGIFFPLPK